MKKLITTSFCLLLLMVSVSIQAQDFKSFKVATGLGYAIPSDGGGGVLFYLEPGYRITDQILVNLRVESALMARAIGEEEGSISGNGSYTLNGQYYLSDNGFRPFVGLGFGIYSLASVEVSSAAAGLGAESKFGFYPRVGFDAGHFNLSIDYNIIGASEFPAIDSNANETTIDVKNGYIGVRFGFSIGGGKS